MTSAPPGTNENPRHLFSMRDVSFLLVLLAAVFLVFSPGLQKKLDGDAYTLTFGNRFVVSPDGLRHILTSDFFAGRSAGPTDVFKKSGYYRPVTGALFWLEYRHAGKSDFIFIADQILIHWLVACMVFILARLIFPQFEAASFLAAALFAFHPLNTFAATQVDARGDVLFLFFYLLSLVLYVAAVKGAVRFPPAMVTLSALFFFLSVFSKEMAVTLPVLLVAFHLFLHFSENSPLRQMLWTLPHWMALAAYFIVRGMVVSFLPYPSIYLREYPEYVVALNAVKSVGIYLARAFIPWGAEYDILQPLLINRIDATLRDPLIYASLLVLCAAFIFACARFKRRPHAAFLIAFFIVSLIPLAGITRVSTVTDLEVIDVPERFFYLPLIPLVFLVVLGVEKLKGTRSAAGRGMVHALAAAVVVFFCVTSYRHSAALNNGMGILKRLYLFDDDKLSAMERMKKRVFYAAFVSVPAGDSEEVKKRSREAMLIRPASPIPPSMLAYGYFMEKNWAEVFRLVDPWINYTPEIIAEVYGMNPFIAGEFMNGAPVIMYLAGNAMMHNGQARDAADLFCKALNAGRSEADLVESLRENYALNGPARCLGKKDEALCAARSPAPDFPEWRPPLDITSCGLWKDRFK